ncbi:MAG: hypothetical protein ABIF77_03100 [bacterium]
MRLSRMLTILFLASLTVMVGCENGAVGPTAPDTGPDKYSIQVEPLPVHVPYALIVVGGAIGDSQQADFNNAAELVYQYCTSRMGCNDGTVTYLNVDVNRPYVDGQTTVINIDAAFTAIGNAMDSDDRVLVYFVGHGEASGPVQRDGFELGPLGASGDPAPGGFVANPNLVVFGLPGFFTFDSEPDGIWEQYWDHQFAQGIGRLGGYWQMTIVLEFCHSGTFVDDTMPSNNPAANDGKYMATACRPNEVANGHPGYPYPTFSYQFFNMLLRNHFLEDAFASAYSSVLFHHMDQQHPMEVDCAPRGNHGAKTRP